MSLSEEIRMLRRVEDGKQRRSRAQRLLQRIERMTKNLRAIAQLSPAIKRQVEEQINREGYPEMIVDARFDNESRLATGGVKWRSLRPSTIKARGSAHPILQDTGALRSAAVRAAKGKFRLTSGVILKVDEIGGGAGEYATYHQTGTSKMVARPFYNAATKAEMDAVGLTERAQEVAVEIVKGMIKKAVSA